MLFVINRKSGLKTYDNSPLSGLVKSHAEWKDVDVIDVATLEELTALLKECENAGIGWDGFLLTTRYQGMPEIIIDDYDYGLMCEE